MFASTRTTKMPTRMMKKLRQPHVSTSEPPMSGPMLGANPMAMPAMPMAVPFCPGGKRVMAMDCTSGKVMPAATACSTRPATKTAKQSETKLTSDPAMNNPSESAMRLRVHIFWARNVTAGTVMPSTSM